MITFQQLITAFILDKIPQYTFRTKKSNHNIVSITVTTITTIEITTTIEIIISIVAIISILGATKRYTFSV